MLSPNSSNRVVLLPQDRAIMEITGLTEDQYRFFVRQAILHSKLRPGEPVAFELVTFAVTLIIGIVLSAISSLLAPKPQVRKTPTVETRNVQGQSIVRGDEFSPKSGFDSLQNVVELGSTVPLVYANRQTIDGISYGGIRVNTNLLLSQIYSVGGGQLLRALFLVGEGNTDPTNTTAMQLNPTQFAIGNNLINGYELAATDAGRITIYYSSDGSRIISSDYLAGVIPSNDLGNAENAGGGDVFQVRSNNNEWKTDFCFVTKPSNQTSFGVDGFIGNNLGFRVNPSFRPALQFTTRTNSEGDALVECKTDRQESARRRKDNTRFHAKSGLIGSGGLQFFTPGQMVEYFLSSNTEGGGRITFGEGIVYLGDVGQAVASRQRQYDELINVGSLYKIGSALAICVSRSPDPFVSDADNSPIGGGQSVSAQFKIIRQGSCDTYTRQDIERPSLVTASNSGHLCRCAIASFTTEKRGRVIEVGLRSALQVNLSGMGNSVSAQFKIIRQGSCDTYTRQDIERPSLVTASNSGHLCRCAIASFTTEKRGRVIEVGLRSALQVNLSGICNFADSWTTTEIDNKACEDFDDDPVSSANPINFTSGTYTGPDQRYSFFRISYRIAGEDSDFIDINYCFGARSSTGVAVYNYIRFEFPQERRYEFRIEPLTAWEIRSGQAPGDLVILDYAVDRVPTLQDGLARIEFSGEVIARNRSNFAIQLLRPRNGNLGSPFDDEDFYGDSWAKLAEAFVYNEITTSATQVEHEVVYINNIAPNPEPPDYDFLAIVGLNIRSSRELNQLNQFSVYVNKGLGSTSAFPDVLYDLFTSARYGTGSIMSPRQIDKASFDAAKAWNYNRRYFFDGAIIEQLNLRTWGAERAQDFLLDLVIRNGKFALQPVANFEGPEIISGLFTAGNIIEDTFQLNYVDPSNRIPPRISVRWREEREASDISSNGLFPSIREIIVREANVDRLAPLERIDMSDFCTSERHAIDRAKWECRFRRYSTHTIRFKTVPSEASLDIGSVFKLGLETTVFEQPQNGAIASDGTVTAWPPLNDGSYSVLLWDGVNPTISETTLTVSGGKSSYSNAVFCLRSGQTNTQTYKTQSLSFDEDGNIEVEAVHFPVNEAGVSRVVDGFDDDNNWFLDGLIGT